MSEDIKVGDIVRVTDWGTMYDSNESWFETQYTQGKIPLIFVARYAYGDNYNYCNYMYDDDTRYKVLYVSDEPKPRILIRDERPMCDKIYLLDIDGVELYDKSVEMTVSEIEKKLGIKNLKIIKESDDD